MELLEKIADYVISPPKFSDETYKTAKLALMDALGCAFAALDIPACQKLLGPVVEGAILPGGARVIGTHLELDPVRASFNNGMLIRWLDYNDTWLAKEWGHPSDNLGALLSLSDYLCRKRNQKITVKELLDALIIAYEIQGTLALSNCFNEIGIDHVILVKVASVAACGKLLGFNKSQIIDALSHAFIDSGPLRTYRHAPCTGSRKSWAAGDQAARAVELALLVERGEMGYPNALDAEKWGFNDRVLKLKLSAPLSSYVMENILFKVKYPAEFHAQTAIEAAIKIHSQASVEEIASIEIETHEAALKIICKEGALKNFADRDHCMQYMVAIALLKGNIIAADYEDKASLDPVIDLLRALMKVSENKQFSIDYLDPKKRSIASTLHVTLKNGSRISETVEYPLGHKRRREEAYSLLFDKFSKNLIGHKSEGEISLLLSLFQSKNFEKMQVHKLHNLL